MNNHTYTIYNSLVKRAQAYHDLGASINKTPTVSNWPTTPDLAAPSVPAPNAAPATPPPSPFSQNPYGVNAGMLTRPRAASPRSQWGEQGGQYGQMLHYLRSSGEAPNVQIGDHMRYPLNQISNTSNAQQKSGLSVNKPLPSQASVRTRSSANYPVNETTGAGQGFQNNVNYQSINGPLGQTPSMPR